MSQQQKLAWYNLAISFCALCMIGLLWWWVGYPVCMAGAGLLGLQGLAPIFFQRAKDRKVQWDERDHQIHKNSVMIAFSVFWIYFTVACMVPWMWATFWGHTTVISAQLPPYILIGGLMVMTNVQSVAILVQYGWPELRDERK